VRPEQASPFLFHGGIPKIIFHVPNEPVSMETKKKTQLLSRVNYSSIAICWAKMTYFEGCVIYSRYFKIFFIFFTISPGNLTDFVLKPRVLRGSGWETRG
jgi:hypothetical protein